MSVVITPPEASTSSPGLTIDQAREIVRLKCNGQLFSIVKEANPFKNTKSMFARHMRYNAYSDAKVNNYDEMVKLICISRKELILQADDPNENREYWTFPTEELRIKARVWFTQKRGTNQFYYKPDISHKGQASRDFLLLAANADKCLRPTDRPDSIAGQEEDSNDLKAELAILKAELAILKVEYAELKANSEQDVRGSLKYLGELEAENKELEAKALRDAEELAIVKAQYETCKGKLRRWLSRTNS
tara:strand:+ start:157 stop:897 length:741 start_codon:yes stop_codon:yes gene_type:complete